jgi:hypothetical protein
MCVPMEDPKGQQAREPVVDEYTRRAKRDVVLLLEGKMPRAGEDYGAWRPLMTLLLKTFEQEGRFGLHDQIITRLRARSDGMPDLLRGERRNGGYGREWWDLLEEFEERRTPAERQRTAARHRAAIRREAKQGANRHVYIGAMIMQALKERDRSRAELYALFHRSVTAKDITVALDAIASQGWARCERVSTSGRPREVWTLLVEWPLRFDEGQ